MVRELIAQGHEVEVVTALPNHPEGRIHPAYQRKAFCVEHLDGARVKRVWMFAATGAGPKRLVSYLSFCVTSIFALLTCRRPDLIFVESPPLFLGAPAWVASFIWRRPFLFNVADLWPDSAVEMGMIGPGRRLDVLEAFERWIYRRARWVNAVTEGIRTTLLDDKGVPRSRLTFLPNGVDLNLFRPGAPSAGARAAMGDGRVILYAGTVGLAQGLDVALDAVQRVRRTHRDVHLVLLGAGSDRSRLEARVRDEALEGVRFIDPVPVDVVADFYRAAHAGLATLKNLPLFEGARPSKIFPIMASALPVLYSGSGEGARLVQDNGAGSISRPEDVDDLAASMIRVLDDPEAASAMGRAGRALVEREYSWHALVSSWLAEITLDPR